MNVTTVPVSRVCAGNNDRRVFARAELEELAASIAENGLAQPPTLRVVGEGWEIVAGERRVRAMRDVLGWEEIPAIVRELDDSQASAIMLIENVQRVDLDPMEEARGYAARIERFGFSQAEIARVAGVSADRVRSRLALLNLSPEAQYCVTAKQLPLTFAAHMTRLDPNRQLLALKVYQAGPMTVDAYRALCQRLQLEQDQESMFDASSFLAVEDYRKDAIETVADSATVLDEMEADPVGAADIAQRLRVKPQTVAQWKNRGIMPDARWTVSGIPVWQWSDVVEWARATKRMPANPA